MKDSIESRFLPERIFSWPSFQVEAVFGLGIHIPCLVKNVLVGLIFVDLRMWLLVLDSIQNVCSLVFACERHL